jgi:hypothetical protein
VLRLTAVTVGVPMFARDSQVVLDCDKGIKRLEVFPTTIRAQYDISVQTWCASGTQRDCSVTSLNRYVESLF